MSGRRGRPGRNNNSESKYPDENDYNQYRRQQREEEEGERQRIIAELGYDPNENNRYNNNVNNEGLPNNYNYNAEYEEYRAQQEAAAAEPNYYYPNYYNEENEERKAQQKARNKARKENVIKGLNMLPPGLPELISEFEGPVSERYANVFPNFPGNPRDPNAFLPVPRNREVNPELPGNPWNWNAFYHKKAAWTRPQATASASTGRWKRKNRKTRRTTRKLRRSQRKNRK